MTTSDDSLPMRPPIEPALPLRSRRGELATFAEVLAAACEGDSWAFDELYRQLARPLRGFAIARGADDPDGLVNDVLVEVFRSLPRFTGDESAFRGFVFHIARKRLIDQHRRSRRRPSTSPLDRAPDAAVIRPSELPHELPRLALETTLRALDALTDDQRDVLVLRVVSDLSIAETAAAIDKPITAVKALQRRGVAALRRRLAEETPAEEVSR